MLANSDQSGTKNIRFKAETWEAPAKHLGMARHGTDIEGPCKKKIKKSDEGLLHHQQKVEEIMQC